jgi:hypothetical protein
VLAEIRARALGEVHPRLAELVAATPAPFLQTIVYIGVSRTVFGRACLLGDAAFVVRPHTAAAAAKATRCRSPPPFTARGGTWTRRLPAGRRRRSNAGRSCSNMA